MVGSKPVILNALLPPLRMMALLVNGLKVRLEYTNSPESRLDTHCRSLVGRAQVVGFGGCGFRSHWQHVCIFFLLLYNQWSLKNNHLSALFLMNTTNLKKTPPILLGFDYCWLPSLYKSSLSLQSWAENVYMGSSKPLCSEWLARHSSYFYFSDWSSLWRREAFRTNDWWAPNLQRSRLRLIDRPDHWCAISSTCKWYTSWRLCGNTRPCNDARRAVNTMEAGSRIWIYRK